MLSIRRVLFPVDLSEACSFTALDVARIVRHFDAELTLLHVIQMVPPWYGELAVESFLEMVDGDTIVQDRRRALDDYLRHPQELCRARRVLLQGDPGSVITDFARREQIDLIMMPTYGSGAIHRMLLGSVTAKVLRDAECPVWVDSHGGHTTPLPDGRRVILCAVETRPGDVAAIQWAEAYAASWRAELKLLHVIPGMVGPVPGSDARTDCKLVDEARNTMSELQRQAGTKAEAIIRGGKIPETVRQVAMDRRADLIVIGPGAMREPFGRLRTTAYGIISKAPCPVVRV